MENPFLRQEDLVNQHALERLGVTVVGFGSIGSFTALTLAKMGIKNFVVYDFDTVELHNISNQFFSKKHVGYNKATVADNILKEFGSQDLNLTVKPFKFDREKLTTEIVLASADDMKARRNIFRCAIMSKKPKLFLDVRMGGKQLTVFAVDLTNPKECDEFYEKYLLDVENQEIRCTAKTIIFNVLMCSSLLSSFVADYANHKVLPKQFRYSFNEYYQILKKRMENDK